MGDQGVGDGEFHQGSKPSCRLGSRGVTVGSDRGQRVRTHRIPVVPVPPPLSTRPYRPSSAGDARHRAIVVRGRRESVPESSDQSAFGGPPGQLVAARQLELAEHRETWLSTVLTEMDSSRATSL